jgi:dihydrofolate synthase/folylpolyglutamate synthase
MVKLPHLPIPYGTQPIRLGLSRVATLLNKLGNPHLYLPPVVHIAGTNGKGSTLAYLTAILESAGYAVHRYTSPHLMRFNERIYLAGQEIDDGLLYRIMEETRIAAEDLQTTFFEGTTAGAFLAFSRVKADILLLETGMGGRLDATNIIPHPRLTIITPIAMDHVEYLGDTLAKIAYEKAGIIKPHVPCVISQQQPEALAVLVEKCVTVGAPYFAWQEHWDFSPHQEEFEFIDDEGTTSFPNPGLLGPHQVVNASTAIAALQCLEGFDVRYKDIIQGLRKVKWPARMQRITNGVLHSILPQGFELWLDGAHNAHGAEALARTIRGAWHEDDSTLFIINGRTKDRDIEIFLMAFQGLAKNIIAVQVQSEPKAEDPEKICSAAQALGWKDASVAHSLKEAILRIIGQTQTPKTRILICGSLYLAGDVMLQNAA